jgi:hypothetical protein
VIGAPDLARYDRLLVSNGSATTEVCP